MMFPAIPAFVPDARRRHYAVATTTSFGEVDVAGPWSATSVLTLQLPMGRAHGGDVDDVTAVQLHHLGDDTLGDVEEPAEVQPHHAGEVILGVLGERPGDEHPGVVDERVDPAELRDRLPDHPVGDRRVGDVPGDGEDIGVVRRCDGEGVGHDGPTTQAVHGDDCRADASGGAVTIATRCSSSLTLGHLRNIPMHPAGHARTVPSHRTRASAGTTSGAAD